MTIQRSSNHAKTKVIEGYLRHVGRLRIRDDLEFLEGEHIEPGAVLVRDSHSQSYCVVSEMDYAVMELIHDCSSLDEIIETFAAEYGEILTAESVRETLNLCHDKRFFELVSYGESIGRLSRKRTRKVTEYIRESQRRVGLNLQADKETQLKNALRLRDPVAIAKVTGTLRGNGARAFHVAVQGMLQAEFFARKRLSVSLETTTLELFDPTAFLEFILPLIKLYYRTLVWPLSVLSCCLIVLGLDWGDVTHEGGALTPWEFLGAYALGAVLHETLGHAGALRYVGGKPGRIGLLLLFFIAPGVACNVTDSYRLSSLKDRVVVMAAGGFLNLHLAGAAAAAHVLGLGSQGFQNFCLAVVYVNAPMAFLNWFPLVKMDGYYILSDILNVTDLERRSRNAEFYFVRRFLTGTPIDWSAIAASKSKALLLFGYSVTKSLWIASTTAAMVLALTARTVGLWGGLGVVLLLILLIDRIIEPVRRVYRVNGLAELRRTIVRPTCVVPLLLAACVVCFYPLPWTIRVPLELEPQRKVAIKAPYTGSLTVQPPGEGTRVQGGYVLTRLRSADLEKELAVARATLAAARARQTLVLAGASPEEERAAKAAIESATKRASAATQSHRNISRGIALVDRSKIMNAAVRRLESEQLLAETARRVGSITDESREEEIFRALWQVKEAEAALGVLQERQKDGSLIAPFAGVVRKRHYNVGEIVRVGEPLVDLDALEPILPVAKLSTEFPLQLLALEGEASALLAERGYKPLLLRISRLEAADSRWARLEFEPVYSQSGAGIRSRSRGEVLLPLEDASILEHLARYVLASSRNSLSTLATRFGSARATSEADHSTSLDGHARQTQTD